MYCLEPCLGAVHLQKVNSAFLCPSKRAGGQKCPKRASRGQTGFFGGGLLFKSGIDFFDVVWTAKHYMKL